MAFAPASLYWCRACKVGSSAACASPKITWQKITWQKITGRNHASIDPGCDIGRGAGPGWTGGGAVADRYQVQPRRGLQHAQGCRGREVQGTCREIYRRQGQDRDLSEFDALQGQGRTGGAAARRGADAGAVEFQVRPDRGTGIRGVRSSLYSA